MVDYNKDDILLIARHLSEQGDYYSPQWEQAADEIERLREALLEIKDMPIRKSQPPWSIHAEYFHIARAALGEGK